MAVILLMSLGLGNTYAQTTRSDSIKSMRKSTGNGDWLATGGSFGFVNVSSNPGSRLFRLKINNDSIKNSYGFIPPVIFTEPNNNPVALAPLSDVFVDTEELLELEAYDPDDDDIIYIITQQPKLVTLDSIVNNSGFFEIDPKDGLFPEEDYKDTLRFKVQEKERDQLESNIALFPFEFFISDTSHVIQGVDIVSQTNEKLTLELVMTDKQFNKSYDFKFYYLDFTDESNIQADTALRRTIPFADFTQKGDTLKYKFEFTSSEKPYLFTTANIISSVDVETEDFSDSYSFAVINTSDNSGESFRKIDSEGGVFYPFGSKKKTRERKRVSSRLYAAEVDRSRVKSASNSLVRNATVRITKGPTRGKISIPVEVKKTDILKEWELNYTPQEDASYVDSVEFEVTSALTGLKRRAYTYIEVEAVNDAPSFTDIQNQQTLEETPVTVDLNYWDPDKNDVLDVSVKVSDQKSLSYSLNDKKLTLTPSKDYSGLVNVTVEIREQNTTDKFAKYQSFNLTIDPVNDKPILTAIADKSIDEDKTFTLELSATDVDAKIPVFRYDGTLDKPQDATIAFNDNSLTVTPRANFNGPLTLKLIADDQEGKENSVSDTVQFILNVNSVNDAPVNSSSIPKQELLSTYTDFKLDLKPFFEDIETKDEELIYTVDASSLFSMSNDKGILSIVPKSGQSGTEKLKITASDGELSVEQMVDFELIANSTDIIVQNPISDIQVNEDFGSRTIDLGNIFKDNTNAQAQFTYVLTGLTQLTGRIENSQLIINSKADFFGKETVYISAKSNGKVSFDQFEINVLPVNDPPIIKTVPSQRFNEDTKLQLVIEVTDVDTPIDQLTLSANSSETSIIKSNQISQNNLSNGFTLTLNPEQDKFGTSKIDLTVSDQVTTSQSSFDAIVQSVNDNPFYNGISFGAAVEDTNFEITLSEHFSDRDQEQLTFEPGNLPSWLKLSNGKLSGKPENKDVGTSSFTVVAKDANGGFVRQPINIEVRNTNDNPTADALQSLTATEDVFFSQAIDTTVFKDIDKDLLTYTATITNGDWLSFEPNSKRLLGTPENKDVGAATVKITATDPSGAKVDNTFEVKAINVNDLPTALTLDNNRIQENKPALSIIGNLTTTDIDANETHSYTLVDGDGSENNSAFIIENNVLKVKNSLNYEEKSSYKIRIRTTDSGSAIFESPFIVEVINIEEKPESLQLSTLSFNENVPKGYEVATISSKVQDNNTSLTYSLVTGDGSTDNNKFSINLDKLLFNDTANYEVKRTYNIRIKSTTSGGESIEESIELMVNNLNEAPKELNLSSTSADENMTKDNPIASITAIDEDLLLAELNEELQFKLITGEGGSDNAAFNIRGDKLYLNDIPDFETKNIYNILIEVVDRAGLKANKSFQIKINDLNEKPTELTIDALVVKENEAENTAIGQFTTTDPDSNEQSHSYTFINGDGSEDNDKFKIINGQLQTRTPLNFEEKATYSIRVSSSDKGNLSIEEKFSISVTDQNDSPTEIKADSTLTISEATAIDTPITTFTVTDEDKDDFHFIKLTEGTGAINNDFFKIENNVLYSAKEFDFEERNSYSIRVIAEDIAGESIEEVFVINLTNEEESKIELDPSLDFGIVSVGESNSTPLIISNTGDTDVTIESIETPEGFSTVSVALSVNTNSSLSIPIKFEPSEEKAYSGTLIVNTTAGNFEVSVTGQGVTVTSLDRNLLEDVKFTLYPNPASSFINIDLSTVPYEVQNFQIFDTRGKVMMQGQRNDSMQLQVNIKDYTEGVYYFSLIHEGQRAVKKFIVFK